MPHFTMRKHSKWVHALAHRLTVAIRSPEATEHAHPGVTRHRIALRAVYHNLASAHALSTADRAGHGERVCGACAARDQSCSATALKTDLWPAAGLPAGRRSRVRGRLRHVFAALKQSPADDAPLCLKSQWTKVGKQHTQLTVADGGRK